jgi:hypothetical protein
VELYLEIEMTPQDMKLLDPATLMAFVAERGIFFLRSSEDYPSADEMKMLGPEKAARFVAGCWGWIMFEGDTLCSAVTVRQAPGTESERQELTARTGAALMNQIAKRIIARREAEAGGKQEIFVPGIAKP